VEIKIIAHTEGIPNWIFGANKKLPTETQKRIQDAVLKIPVGTQALKADHIRRFVPTPDHLNTAIMGIEGTVSYPRLTFGYLWKVANEYQRP